jgi:hypothetical protein
VSAFDDAVRRALERREQPWGELTAPWRERALAAEARVRDLEETVGELLALMPHVVDVRHIDWPPR